MQRRAVRAMQSSWASSAQNHFRTALMLPRWNALRAFPGTTANWARRAEEGLDQSINVVVSRNLLGAASDLVLGLLLCRGFDEVG